MALISERHLLDKEPPTLATSRVCSVLNLLKEVHIHMYHDPAVFCL